MLFESLNPFNIFLTLFRILYVQDGLHGESRPLLDPNTLSADGTVAINAAAPSRDGEIYAYGLSSKGSDWVTIHFKNVSSGEDFPEVLQDTKWPSIEWTVTNTGIFYNVTFNIFSETLSKDF